MESTDAHTRLEKAADSFTRQLAALADEYKVPAAIFNQHSILHIDLCGVQHLTSHIDDDELTGNLLVEMNHPVPELDHYAAGLDLLRGQDSAGVKDFKTFCAISLSLL